MTSTITLKRRIRSIKNTSQITKAMELVSASKLRRAQDYAQKSRDYYELANELLSHLSSIDEVERQPLFEKRPLKRKLYIVITSNTGLAGAYNANILKLLTTNLMTDQAQKIESKVIGIGNKGSHFVRRLNSAELVAAYPAYGDHPTANDIRPLLNTVIKMFKDKEVDEVDIVSMLFKSTISQSAVTRPLLPSVKLDNPISKVSSVSNFEPDIDIVIDQIAVRLIEAEIWQAVLEALASEHAMRMLAMKNASDNAKDLIDDYTLELNTARQAGITQELAEISGGVEALKE